MVIIWKISSLEIKILNLLGHTENPIELYELEELEGLVVAEVERLDAHPDGVGRHRVAPPRPRAGHRLDARLVVVDREVVGRRLPATSSDQVCYGVFSC